jgi:hypothetical protein
MADVAVEHYEGLLALYGREVGIRHARKHLAAYADAARDAGFCVDATDRQALVTSLDPVLVVRVLRRVYAQPGLRAA